jgi:hypothetical protein
MSAFDFNLIMQSFKSIDSEKMYQYPIAILKFIFYNARYGDMQLAKKTIVDFKRFYDVHEPLKYTQNRLFAELYLICFVVCYNNVPAMSYFTKKAYDLLDGQHSIIFNRNYVLTFGFPHFSGAFYSEPGKYRETIKVLADNFHYHTEVTGGMGMGYEYLCSAEYLLETGMFNDVENLALKAIYKASTRQQICIIVGAKMTIARLLIMQGRLSEVEAILTELVAVQ